MSLKRIQLLAGLLCCLAGCSLAPTSNPYQLPAGQSQPQQAAVTELEQQAWARAADYLQRAIRIEPRNPLSWHYLAQSYRGSGDYARCVEMAQRSFSYGGGERLDTANRQLRASCERGF